MSENGLYGHASDAFSLRTLPLNVFPAVETLSPQTFASILCPTNQFPIQDFYLVQAIRRGDGKYVTSAKQKIFADYADRQAQKCPM